MSTYIKPYAKNEFNFELKIPNNNLSNDFVVIVFNNDVELEIWGCQHRKTDGTGTEVAIQIDAEQLATTPTGGVDCIINVDFLRANRDLQRGDITIESIDLIKDDISSPLIVDRNGALNIYRCGGIASKGATSLSSVGETLFKYTLKRNTSYLIRSSVLVGGTGTSESFLYGILRDL